MYRRAKSNLHKLPYLGAVDALNCAYSMLRVENGIVTLLETRALYLLLVSFPVSRTLMIPRIGIDNNK
jgi:hypothetical protein